MIDMNDENVDKKTVLVIFGYNNSKASYRNSVHFKSMKSAKKFISDLNKLMRDSADAELGFPFRSHKKE